MKSPFYIAWVIIVLGYLAMANMRGWSLFHSLSPSRLFSGRPSSGFHHK